MLKFSDNPPILHPNGDALSDQSGLWWVAHTKARFEKAFAWDLHRRGITYFLPMVERIKVYGSKKRRVMIPLFTSYVFFCGSDQDRYASVCTGRLCQAIPVPDQAGLLADLNAVQRVISGQTKVDPHPFAAIGQRCRVTAGPFEGVEGVVVDRRRQCKFVLEVRILGRGASMYIDGDLLEPVEEARPRPMATAT